MIKIQNCRLRLNIKQACVYYNATIIKIKDFAGPQTEHKNLGLLNLSLSSKYLEQVFR